MKLVDDSVSIMKLPVRVATELGFLMRPVKVTAYVIGAIQAVTGHAPVIITESTPLVNVGVQGKAAPLTVQVMVVEASTTTLLAGKVSLSLPPIGISASTVKAFV